MPSWVQQPSEPSAASKLRIGVAGNRPGMGNSWQPTRRLPMYKKYIVRLSDEERRICQEVVKKLKGSSQKVRRAQILLKADADGPNWTDTRIAEAYHCRVQT